MKNALSYPSQLLLRSLEYFEQGHWAIVNPTDADIFGYLPNTNIVGLHQYHHHYVACTKYTKHAQLFGASFRLNELNNKLAASEANTAENGFDGIIIYMPKSKQQLAMLIDNAATLVQPGAVIMVVGENKSGIKSVAKLLEKVGQNVNKIDSAKHCGLYAVTVEKPKSQFSLHDYAIKRVYTINEQAIEVYSLPGVFGHKQLDPGTDLLLQQLTPQALTNSKGHVYDFACGSGVIGCYLAKLLAEHQCTVSMSDVSALAIYCSEQTAKLNKVNVNIVACDGLAKLNKKFDIIVSNPPFHEGIRNDYSITESFIKQAYSHSNQYANITIVANRFLPYPDILDKVYSGFTTVAASNKYRVYGAQKFAS